MPQNSALVDFLDWVNRFPQVPLNVLRGRPGAAMRQAGDIVGGVVDLLPGDVVPQFHKPEDEARLGEMIGLQAGGLAERATTDTANALLNPITWLPMMPKVHKPMMATAEKAAGLIPASVRRTLGWDKVDPDAMNEISSAKAHGAIADTAGMSYAKSRLKIQDLTADEDKALWRIVQNVEKQPDGQWRQMSMNASPEVPDTTLAMQQALRRSIDYAAAHPEIDPKSLARIQERIQNYYPFAKSQFDEAVTAGAIDPAHHLDDYLQLAYEDMTGIDSGQSNARKARSARGTGQTLAQHFNAFPDVSPVESFSDSVQRRAQGQGGMIKRAMLIKGLMAKHPEQFAGLRPSDVRGLDADKATLSRSRLYQTLNDPASDTKARLRYEIFGSDKPTGAMSKAIEAVNPFFKGAAVYGMLIPKFAGIVRNRMTGIPMLASTPEGRALLLKEPVQVLKDLWGAFDDAYVKNLTGSRLPADRLSGALDTIENAYTKSNGTINGVIENLKDAPELQNALKNGVLNGFVSSEQVGREIIRDPNLFQKLFVPGGSRIANAPTIAFQSVEQRMRLGTFLDLRSRGVDPQRAANLTREMYFDYDYSSPGNRAMRELFPFAQFPAQAIKQTAKMAVNQPAVLPIAAQFIGNDDDIAPWQEQQVHAKVGDRLVSGFGAPIESLNLIPNLSAIQTGQDVGGAFKGILDALHPLAKAPTAMLVNQDPFTRKPLAEAGEDPFSYLYKVGAASGILQPAASIAGAVNRFTDQKGTLGEDLLKTMTGVSSSPIDPLRAQQNARREQLKDTPGVKQATMFYAPNRETDVEAVLRVYREQQKLLKDRAMQGQAQGLPSNQP